MLNDPPARRYPWTELLPSQRIPSRQACPLFVGSALDAIRDSGSIQVIANQRFQSTLLNYCFHLMNMAVPADILLYLMGITVQARKMAKSKRRPRFGDDHEKQSIH